MTKIMKSLGVIVISLLSITAVYAQGPRFARAGAKLQMNEDLKYVREWQHSQKMKELAEALALTDEQVQTLKTTKGEIEALRQACDTKLSPIKSELDGLYAQLRAGIEDNGTLNEEIQTKIAEKKKEMMEIQRETRKLTFQASAGLKDLLTEEQMEALKSTLAPRNRGFGNRGKGLNKANKGGRRMKAGRAGGRGDRRGMGRMGGRRGGGMVMLLSDEFLANY